MKTQVNSSAHSLHPLFHPTNPRAWLTAILMATSLPGCGTSLDTGSSTNANEPLAWGTTEFALTAELNGVRYALRDAEIVLAGPEDVVLRSNDTPNEETLVKELESGQYTLELLPGYRLVALSDDGDVEVQATLETPNPQTLLVAANQTTAVNMLFRVADEAVSFGRGSVAVGLSIEPAEPGGVFFSEFMVNPTEVADTEGEWIELMNTSNEDFQLEGCSIQRDDSSFTIAASLTIPAGGFVTLANGAPPGFTPSMQYSAVSLPNTAIFSLSLTCGGVELDSLQVDPGSWPLSAGASASLSADHALPSSNDDGANWCLASTNFGADFGTPGAANDACPN